MPFLSSTTVPSTQRAIKIQGSRQASVVQDAAVPTPRDNEVLIRVVCVALNPVDWKSAELSPSVGATWGIDFSGEVATVGNAVESSRFPIGQAVCGAAFGNNPDDHAQGAFAEYVAIPADLLFTVPKGMSFEQAATIGTGVATAGLALYQTLQLPWPSMKAPKSEPSQYVLVQGAGTATGTILVQMILLSGLIPIATCSSTSIDRVTKLGAIQTFDYTSPTCGADIRAYTHDTLAHVVDCISTADSMKICYDALSTAGGKYVALDPFPIRSHTRRVVKPNWIIGFTIYGCRVNWKRPYYRDARPRDREFGANFFAWAQELLDEGRLETHPRRVEKGGLEGVIRGAEMGRKGEIKGVKVVYRV